MQKYKLKRDIDELLLFWKTFKSDVLDKKSEICQWAELVGSFS